MTTRSRVALCVAAAASLLLLLPPTVLMLIIASLAGGTVGGGGCGGDGGPGGGSQQVGPRTWNGEQTANAQTITSVVIARGLPRRAAVLAVATAIVESGLRNLNFGDRDSLGLFQQRPSQGWGSTGTILNPALATGQFLTHLIAIPGWATMAPGRAEQAVQRSARPGAYGPQESAAADLVAKFWTGPDVGLPTPGASAPGGGDELASFAVLGCPDQGASDIPIPPGSSNPKSMPPGFSLPTDPTARRAVSYAIAQLGKPYVWGARGPNAFDCSGLTQAAWATAGVPVSSTTATQVHDGTAVTGLDLAQPGDLLFTPGAGGSNAHPGHVGIYAGAGLLINAYDTSKGVIVEKLATWAPKVVAIRRVGPPASGPVGSRA